MSIIRVNGRAIDLKNTVTSVINIDNQPDILIECDGGNDSILKRILFIGLPIRYKTYNNITHIELAKIKRKFRVNYEQAAIYKIIETINFYDFVVILTVGFDNAGIEYLSEIKHFFEFSDKRIFIVKMQPATISSIS